METQPGYLPTTGKLKELGIEHQIRAQSENGNLYIGAINAPDVLNATRMVCKWPDSDLWQVAHKEKGEGVKHWKFKGFGTFNDEAHFIRLLDMPPIGNEEPYG